MELRQMMFGDGANTTKGWLIIYNRAVRGVLLEHGGGYLLHFAHDKVLQTKLGHPIFTDWQSATSWIEQRLKAANPPTQLRATAAQ